MAFLYLPGLTFTPGSRFPWGVIDILGYMAMMQADQAQAMAAVKGFEAVLRERIAPHQGELPQP